ncbi:hypothetical protein HIM_05971 [Hirsutella minnesotensis 3608]|uniref:Cross-pathway control protein 1 n=1 Tax=Hirsutella minnesotensis 3608 TaxID=1043627 RepID=A0A0F7ZJQ6_9HYPO|nr:hypothetical protein HIM_05971 [Hirsutella minnesotensis 3608]
MAQVSSPPLRIFPFATPQASLNHHIEPQRLASGGHQDVVNDSFESVPPSRQSRFRLQTLQVLFSPLNLNSVQITTRSLHSTANISAQDFSVFTTDSQSTWLPNSASALPASSAQQLQSPVEEPLPQQDFVLFDSPQPLSLSRPDNSLSNSQRRHSYHNRRDKSASPAVQNQRVAQLQGIGNQSLANVNRFNHQFYASSAPSSTISLNQNQPTSRPPVPLFNQSASPSVKTAKMMNAADVDLDDFTAFEGGASTAFSSPALPSGLDFNSSTSSLTSNLGTVSPQDLLVQEPFLSTPSSAALTALTSPSLYNGSPDFDGFDVSPNFGVADIEGSGDTWYSLFPQDGNSAADQASSLDNSPALAPEDIEDPSTQVAAGARKKPTGSPTSSTRHSSVSGVNARKRDKPLPPIIVEDPNDSIAMKRARNTLAARKSRERKAQRLEELEERIAKLEAERDHWKSIALSQGDEQ